MKNKLNLFFILYVALFISFFAYAFFFFDTELYYFNNQQLFLFDKGYFKEFLSYPGGISEYLSIFILQFYFYKIAGALLFSSFLIIIYFLLNKIFNQMQNSFYNKLIAFVPLIFFITFQNFYDYNITINLKFIICSSFFLIYLKIYELKNIKYLFVPLSSILIYFITGGLFFLFYILLLISYELLYSEDKLKIISSLFYLLIGFSLPYIAARYVYIISFREAYFYFVPQQVSVKLEYLVYMLIVFIPALFIILKNTNKESVDIKPEKKIITISTVFIYLASLVFLFAFAERAEKQKIKIDYLAYNDKWQQIVDMNSKITKNDILNNYKLNFYNNLNISRALYHTNNLLDHLFDNEQYYDIEGLFANIYAPETAIPAGLLYFDMGQVITAQRYFYEALTNFPHDPGVYKMLVEINLINRNYCLAEKYLNILCKSLIYRSWAGYYSKFINNHEMCENDPTFSEKRNYLPKFHYFTLVNMNYPDWDLKNLLKENKNNKMAFEYLMAYYLLTRQYDEIVSNLKKFAELNYTKLPKHIEEAILVYKMMFPAKWKELIVSEKINISPETLDGFDNFNRIIDEYGNNIEKAK